MSGSTTRAVLKGYVRGVLWEIRFNIDKMWGKKGGRKKGQKAVKFNDGKYSEDQLVAEGFRDDSMFPRRGKKQQQQQIVEEELPLPPGKHEIDPTEELLLKLHTSLVEFYAKNKPENLDEDILTILMQFSIDAGQDALNKKLMKVYGEDLNTFQPAQVNEPPPPYMSTLERKHARHRSLFDRTLPPPPKTVEEELDGETRGPKKGKTVEAYLPHPPPPKDTERHEMKRQSSDILGLNGATPPPTISSQKLEILDHEDFLVLDTPEQPLDARDLIEAFYFLHDETKLNKPTDGIEKFVTWARDHSLEELSAKLKKKYGQSLEDVRGVALRRRNLEDTINEFYRIHDKSKIERADRRVLIKIVNWAMKNGLRQLNKKFFERYGENVVQLPPEKVEEEHDDIDDEL